MLVKAYGQYIIPYLSNINSAVSVHDFNAIATVRYRIPGLSSATNRRKAVTMTRLLTLTHHPKLQLLNWNLLRFRNLPISILS
jgi:hypothetical protein